MAPKKVTFGPTQKLERAYKKGIQRIVGKVLAPIQPEQTLEQWLSSIAERSAQSDVQEASATLAAQMVQWTSRLNYRTWREAASKSQQSRKLFLLLEKEMQGATGARVQQLVRENAAYISSLPLTAAQTLTDEVRRAQQRGARPATVAKLMRQRFPQLLKSRVQLIARTETAKASTALTKARCEDLNIDFYIWVTADDVRVRTSHKKMNSVVIPWSDAPAPEALVGEKPAGHYHAGEIYNCRCDQRPVLTLDDIKFPARVYWQGSIRTMTKQQFKQIAVGLEQRASQGVRYA